MVRGLSGSSIGTINAPHVDDESEFTDLTASFLVRFDHRIEDTPARTARDGLVVLAETAAVLTSSTEPSVSTTRPSMGLWS